MSISAPDFNLEQCKGSNTATDDVYLCLWPTAPNTSPPILPRLTTDMVLVLFDSLSDAAFHSRELLLLLSQHLKNEVFLHTINALPVVMVVVLHNLNVNVEVVQNRKWRRGDCFAQHGPSRAKMPSTMDIALLTTTLLTLLTGGFLKSSVTLKRHQVHR